MPIGSSVPPRAYTREILTTAFNWLQSQPDSVRAKATTPDALVGLYMQAKRGQGAATAFEAEAPVSSQVFMSDLKNLAEGLKEFDDSRSQRSVSPPASARAQLASQPTYQQPPLAAAFGSFDDVSANAAPNVATHLATHLAPTAAAHPAPARPTPQSRPEEPAPTEAASGVSALGLNDRSRQMMREVQIAMNLSSETEVLNLMIAVAHKNLKTILS